VEILKFPHPLLFKKCEPVTVFDTELRFLLHRMYETMKEHNGVGLAANQVGLPFRMFVMDLPNEEPMCLINPRIIEKSRLPASLREGCLSAPGEFLVIDERVSWVKVEFQTHDGAKKVRVFKDLYAVCVQHEIDHLDGKSHLQAMSIPKQKRKELTRKWGLK
jgi:peptide deformylase